MKCDYIARFARANLYRPLMGLDTIKLNRDRPKDVGSIMHDGRRSVSLTIGRKRYIVSSNGRTVECESIKMKDGCAIVHDRAVVLVRGV